MTRNFEIGSSPSVEWAVRLTAALVRARNQRPGGSFPRRLGRCHVMLTPAVVNPTSRFESLRPVRGIQF
jgi:hypothetical protein